MSVYNYLVTYPPGTDDLMETEINNAGGKEIKRKRSRIQFEGSLAAGYRICIHSRIANRLLIELKEADTASTDVFYKEVYEIEWETIIKDHSTIGIYTSGVNNVFRHTRFTSQLAKDAIVDRLRKITGSRPDIEQDNPGLALYISVQNNTAIVYLDISGVPLFKRGYRTEQGDAPLKENVAAAMLLRARWPQEYPNGTLLDPMCGSGTLAIEAAMLAYNIPPGLSRSYFGFFGWKAHDHKLWNKLLAEAKKSGTQLSQARYSINAADISNNAISIAQKNIKAAGLSDYITVKKQDFFSEPIPINVSQNEVQKKLIVMNPPYGKRISGSRNTENDESGFYKQIGDSLKNFYPGWNATIITSPPSLAESLNLKPSRKNSLKNGPLDCTVWHIELFSSGKRTSLEKKHIERTEEDLHENARMLFNRLKKNKRNLKKYIKQQDISSYRIYDKDIPEYAVAIDVYEDTWFHVQEYAPPKTVDPKKAKQRLLDVSKVLEIFFATDSKHVFVKVRNRMRGAEQYRQYDQSDEKYIMRESGHRFYVNFSNYLDTGIFLDHRIVRSRIEKEAAELTGRKKFLNLFCYTATASVYAAKSGCQTTSVDSSATYLAWGRDNFKLNGINPDNHKFIQNGCFEWLKDNKETFDLILLDPPTFSNTKSARQNFSIQEDYIELLALALKALTSSGTLYFSTNFRKFSADFSSLGDVLIKETTEETVPDDFKRNAHRSFSIKKHM